MARKTKEQDKKNQKFSFDQEIIIGVTKTLEPKQEKRKSNKIENRKSTINQNKKKKKKKQNKTKKEMQKQYRKKQNREKKRVLSEEEQEKIREKRKRTIFILKCTMLSVLFITLILCAMFSPLFNIKTIEVQGNEKITENEIISLSQIQINENTFQLNKGEIKKKIKENAYINKVTIKRKLPSGIIITVEERKPAYLLEYGGGYLYLDKQGYFLEIAQEKLELPILQEASTDTTEFVVGNRLNEKDLEKLPILARIMELAQVNSMDSLITRIDIREKEDIKLIFETKQKTAYLGDSSNLNTKILTIKSILEKEEGKAGEIFVNMDLNKENPMFRERV